MPASPSIGTKLALFSTFCAAENFFLFYATMHLFLFLFLKYKFSKTKEACEAKFALQIDRGKNP